MLVPHSPTTRTGWIAATSRIRAPFRRHFPHVPKVCSACVFDLPPWSLTTELGRSGGMIETGCRPPTPLFEFWLAGNGCRSCGRVKTMSSARGMGELRSFSIGCPRVRWRVLSTPCHAKRGGVFSRDRGRPFTPYIHGTARHGIRM